MKKGFLMLAAALLALPLMLSGCTPQDSIGGETPAPSPEQEPSAPAPESTAPVLSPPPPEGPRVEAFSIGRLARGEASYQYAGQQVTRRFYYYIPSTYVEGTALPLMLSLHGSGSNATMQLSESRWTDYAEEEGIIIVAPESTALHANGKISSEGKLPYEIGQSDASYVRWAAVSSDPCAMEGVDDVQYLSDLIDLFVDGGYADPCRVYASGLSHGAFMSLRLALEHPEKIAGIGVVAGLLCVELDEVVLSEQVKVVLIHGTQDTIVPFGGMTYGGTVWAHSSDETAAWFLRQYGIESEPVISPLPDIDPEDGTTITRRAYAGENGVEQVVQYVVEGGGHTWPGGTQYAPVSVCGVVSRDAQASELIWSELKTAAKQ